jgi:hypothetical protein
MPRRRVWLILLLWLAMVAIGVWIWNSLLGPQAGF